jgi:hypothetical protein
MIKKYKIVKLDHRYTGYPSFKYKAIMPYAYDNKTRYRTFYEWFEWARYTWGASKAIRHWLLDKDDISAPFQNESWAWRYDEENLEIFMRDKEEACLFTLTW